MILRTEMKVFVAMPEKPGKIEHFAREELQKYLEHLFGSVCFLEKGEEADAVFVIGWPDRNSCAQTILSSKVFSEILSTPESLYYQVKENTVLLAGSDETGTLYAVYEFLERELGCCFGAFSLPHVHAGETVPSYKSKTLQETIHYCSADLPYRTAIVQFGEEAGDSDHKLTVPFIDYLAKNRYNRILTWVSVYDKMVKLGQIEELHKRGIRLTVGHHQALTTFLPFEGNDKFPTAYGREHPEFFRVMENGERQTSLERVHYGQWLPCSRNEECIEEIAANINRWLEENPVVDTIALWPNDGTAEQCRCPKCAQYSKMENYLYFLNEVAKRLSAAHRERKVDVIVYLDLWDCPESVKLEDNIVIDIATWTPKGLRHCGKPDGSSLLESHICSTMHNFKNTGSRVVLYEYYMGNYGNRQAVMPSADEMQSIFRYFQQHGFDGSGTQMECFNLWNNLLNFYCFGRMAYDTDLTLNHAIQNISRMFGEGAEEIQEIFLQYEKTLDGQVPIDQTGTWLAGNVDASRIYGLFEQALSKAREPAHRNNIRLLRMAFRYTMLHHEDTPQAREELGIMSNFDSMTTNNPGFGIAFVINEPKQELSKDQWYKFEM